MKKPKIVDGQPIFDHECEDCKHTPTPWHTKPHQGHLRMMATIGGADGIQVAYTTPGNAAFIVRAVNSHEALFQAAKNAVATVKELLPRGTVQLDTRELEEAIAIAEAK